MKRFLFNLFIAAGFSLLFALAEWGVTGETAFSQWALDFAVLLLLTFFRGWQMLLALWIILETIQLSFFSYFRRFADATDMKLFFSHISETLESLFALLHLFLTPFAMGIAGLSALFLIRRLPCVRWRDSRWKKGAVFSFFLLIMFNMNPAFRLGVSLVQALLPVKETGTATTDIPSFHAPLHEANLSIFLVIGESLPCSSFVLERFREAGMPARCIVSGATNTDVSVPLLLCGIDDPRHLKEAKSANLFYLASQNGMKTVFISMQSPKALQYINPYLCRGCLDTYVATPRTKLPPDYDDKLVGYLKSGTDRPVFMVMQMIGEHSPYIYFPGPKSDNPAQNYKKAVDYTVSVLERMLHVLRERKRPWLFLFTSDHGEFSGEKGRFGHNTFDPRIYRVPMILASNVALPEAIGEIACHRDLYRLIRTMMGYEKAYRPHGGPCIVNGTMQDRQDGFIEVPRG
ncbi:sulfatase-like hydrolase/transferase [Hydrogenimonas sp. SS33]|uniref:sulfatase-like hydrolase/transferase n=1 Tax=Hydrogenimonas leucolamina TaxID=2954236 RepID=UPI00336BFCFE